MGNFTVCPCVTLLRFINFRRFRRTTAAFPRSHWNRHTTCFEMFAINTFNSENACFINYHLLTEMRSVMKNIVNHVARQEIIIAHSVAHTRMMKCCAQSGQEGFLTFRIRTKDASSVHLGKTFIFLEVTVGTLCVLRAPAFGNHSFQQVSDKWEKTCFSCFTMWERKKNTHSTFIIFNIQWLLL